MKFRIIILTALMVAAATVCSFADVASGPAIYMLYALPFVLIAGTAALICLCIIRIIKKRRGK